MNIIFLMFAENKLLELLHFGFEMHLVCMQNLRVNAATDCCIIIVGI